jgi:small subunit ribosomal protein S2
MSQGALLRQLIEAGAHFGHQTHRWNPKMSRYIFGERSNIHIIDLSLTLPLLDAALLRIRETAAQGGRILMVGTKRQASDHIAAAAKRCAQYYVNHRWLGGTLTNWQTVSKSIQRLHMVTDLTSQEGPTGLTKKELLNLTREREKLDRSLGGIAGMGGTPDLMFVIDTNKEAIAIQEARKLGIPVVAIVDTNCDPDLVDFPIPGNDDAARAIQMYCDMIADAALDGLAQGQAASGVDIGASENPQERAGRRRERAPRVEEDQPEVAPAAVEEAAAQFEAQDAPAAE